MRIVLRVVFGGIVLASFGILIFSSWKMMRLAWETHIDACISYVDDVSNLKYEEVRKRAISNPEYKHCLDLLKD